MTKIKNSNKDLLSSNSSAIPSDILYGLAHSDREFICLGLALFEDTLLSRRVKKITNQALNKITTLTSKSNKDNLESITHSVMSRKEGWLSSSYTDDTLRLILWIYLREAFCLQESISISSRGIERVADDLVAAAIVMSDKKSFFNRIKNHFNNQGKTNEIVTLDNLCFNVISELLGVMLGSDQGKASEKDQKSLIENVRHQIESMDLDTQQKILKSVQADELNDEAIRKILLTSGGLAAFSGAVGMAGFSAYILAAQASAIVPFLSGPALVSIVSVLSNPVTVIAATAVSAWWFSKSANQKVKSQVATRIISLLTLQGLVATNKDHKSVVAIFASAPSLSEHGDLTQDVIQRYQNDWSRMNELIGIELPSVDKKVHDLMESPLDWGHDYRDRFSNLLFPKSNSVEDIVTLGALTIGDVLYHAAAIDPAVIKAVDFSRTADISNLLEFSEFSQTIMAMSPSSLAGALNNAHGYVAEQVVAMELSMQGHQVSFPDTSNEPGWDLLVDGEKFQVKCLSDTSGLAEHFSKYDYPVLANAELAEKIPAEWAEKVFFVEGYSNEFITQLTDKSLSNGEEMLDPEVPLFAFCLSAIRNYETYQSGRINMQQAVHQILLDGTARVGLATLGGYAGSAIGLLAFGPAGALVLGSTIPVVVQAQSSRVTGKLNECMPEYVEWEGKAGNLLNECIDNIYHAIERKIVLLREKYKQLGDGVIGDYLRIKFSEEARYLRESRARLEHIAKSHADIEGRIFEVLKWIGTSTVHPVHYQEELTKLSKIMNDRPLIAETAKSYMSEMIERSKKKVFDKF